MKILNFNPSKELFFENSIPNYFFDSINEIMNQRNKNTEISYRPLADIKETENEFLIEVQLPGLKKEQVNVEIEKNLLKIWGTKTRKAEGDTSNYLQVETYEGNFKRSFKLSENIDKTAVSAKMENGVLTIELKKVNPTIEKTEIVIQ
jgi:HSP20 family protein